MNKSFALFTAFLVGVPWLGYGQGVAPTPDPEHPTAPLVARAPDFAAWTVDYTQKKASQPMPTPVPVAGAAGRTAPVPPQKVLKMSVVTKTGTLIRDVRTYTDGTRSENWWTHGRILRQDPEAGFINIIDPGIDRSAPQFNVTDFESFNWVDLAHFTRSDTRRGVECFLYEWKERAPSAAEFDKLKDYGAKSMLYLRFRGKPTVPTQAWVSKETHLPVATDDEYASCTYTYQKPPTEPLKLPDAFQKAWDHYQGTLDDWKAHVMPRQR